MTFLILNYCNSSHHPHNANESDVIWFTSRENTQYITKVREVKYRVINGRFEVFPMILLANLGVGYKLNPIKIFISDKRDENFKLHWQVVQSFGAPRRLL